MKQPIITKAGTVECDMVETTPVVFRGVLYRFESVRSNFYEPSKMPKPHFHFLSKGGGGYTPEFAQGFQMGSAHVEGDRAYVYGVDACGAEAIHVFWSDDLKQWTSQVALEMPGWGIYNTSVCKGPDGFVMAFEVGEPQDVAGVRFTIYFARSDDLLNWKFMGMDRVYSKDRYTACPAIRYHDGFYYMFYLEEIRPPAGGVSYQTYLVRTADFLNWQPSPLNPVLRASDEDRAIACPVLTPEQCDRISKAGNINNSDIDLCEHDGRVVIYYSWGNQSGTEHLGLAHFDGTLAEMLEAFFPG